MDNSGTNGTNIQVRSGVFFDPLNPTPEGIRIEDIAHSLSNLCRFTGHSNVFYSVAQHSVLVSYLMTQSNTASLWGLLHDATEAYIGDINRPLKVYLNTQLKGGFAAMENNLMAVIAEKFGLPPTPPDNLNLADNRALAAEKRDLMGGPDWPNMPEPPPNIVVTPWSPAVAKDHFLQRFYALSLKIAAGYE